MNKKIFFFDMDGTIVDSNSNVRPATVESLVKARSKGHKIAIATGRPYADIIRDVNKDNYDYLIANNGVYFYDVKNDEFVENGEISKDVVLTALELAKKNKGMFAVHANRQAYRIMFAGEEVVKNAQNNDPNFRIFKWTSEEEILNVINKFSVAQASIRHNEEKILELEKFMNKNIDGVEIHIANTVYLDINPVGMSKLVGVESVLKKENMVLEQAITFGDSGNDIEMIEGAGLGIAMGNSTQNLKDIADEIIGDNNSDAIAIAIEKLI